MENDGSEVQQEQEQQQDQQESAAVEEAVTSDVQDATAPEISEGSSTQAQDAEEIARSDESGESNISDGGDGNASTAANAAVDASATASTANGEAPANKTSSARMLKEKVLKQTSQVSQIAKKIADHNAIHHTHQASGQGHDNPFVYHDMSDTDPDIYQWEMIKYCVIGPMLAPLRIVGCVTLVLIASAISNHALSLAPKFPRGVNAPELENHRLAVAYLSRALLFVCGFYWVNVKGKPCSTKDARLVVIAPHQTVVDSFFMIYAYGMPSFIGKEEASTYPLIGPVLRFSDGVFFKRESREAKDTTIDAIKKRAQDEQARHLCLFPTGTCTSPSCLICFKRGAFLPGEPVQPVLLRYPYKYFNPTWSGAGPNRVLMTYRLLCQLYNRLDVEFMPVYFPSEEEKADAFLYANNVRKVMADALGVPTTEHSYDDMFLAKEARRLKVPIDDALPFEFQELKRLLEIDLGDAKALMKRFFEDKSFDHKNGKMDVNQFAKLIGIPLTEPVVDIFSVLDDTGSGYIDFPSFLIGLTMIRKNLMGNSEEGQSNALQFVFDTLDKDKTGVVTKTRLTEVLSSYFANYDQAKFLEAFKTKEEVNFEEFKDYMAKHPEYLMVSLSLASRAEDTTDIKKRSRRLTVLMNPSPAASEAL